MQLKITAFITWGMWPIPIAIFTKSHLAQLFQLHMIQQFQKFSMGTIVLINFRKTPEKSPRFLHKRNT